MTYQGSENTVQSGTPATPPWLQFAPPETVAPPTEGDTRSEAENVWHTTESSDMRAPAPVPAQHPQMPRPAPPQQQFAPHQPAPQRVAPAPPFPAPQPPAPQAPQPGFPQYPGPQYPPAHSRAPIPAPPFGTPPSGHEEPHGGPALDEVALLRKARRAPSRGWRRAVHTISAGTINPGESQGDIELKRLLERVNRPVRGDYRIAVLSLKGGVGKTTTTVGLGSTFSSLRGDRVIAVDANPDLGTLAQRIPQQTRSTVRDLLADDNVFRYSDVRAHTSQAPSRLEVIASERDPAMAEAFNEEEYRGVVSILQRFYNIIVTDCGTGKTHHEPLSSAA